MWQCDKQLTDSKQEGRHILTKQKQFCGTNAKRRLNVFWIQLGKRPSLTLNGPAAWFHQKKQHLEVISFSLYLLFQCTLKTAVLKILVSPAQVYLHKK